MLVDFSKPEGYIYADASYLNVDENVSEKDLFVMTVNGNGMINAGIHDGDLLFFYRTEKFENGDIVAISAEGETMVRRIFKDRKRVKLRREIGTGEDTYVTDYTLHGRLVGFQRKM